MPRARKELRMRSTWPRARARSSEMFGRIRLQAIKPARAWAPDSDERAMIRSPPMLGLTLVGDAHPRDRDAIRKAVHRPEALPEAYVELIATWGPGRLCGVVELPDPTLEAGRFH